MNKTYAIQEDETGDELFNGTFDNLIRFFGLEDMNEDKLMDWCRKQKLVLSQVGMSA